MFEVKFADIGEGIHEGVLYQWLVQEGETISEGQGLFMVETDKVTAEIPSPVQGVIKVLNGKVGDTIYVGNTIVIIDDGTEIALVNERGIELSKPEIEAVTEQGSTSVVGEIEVSSQLIPNSIEKSVQVDTQFGQLKKILATPVARKLAKDLNVDISTIRGSGPMGRVMKEDIYAQEKNQSHFTRQEGSIIDIEGPITKSHGDEQWPEEYIKMSMRRKSIAKNMVLSKYTIPHASAMDEVDVTDLVAFRNLNKDMTADLGYKLTYMPFIIKAVVLSLKEHPVLNASLDPKGEMLILKKYYNIGIAVDDEEGLIVPVIHHADQMGVLECAAYIASLIKNIEQKHIILKDIQNGTFTITNYGSVGALYGVPVIRYPESAVLGVGTVHQKPLVIEGEIVIRYVLPLSISFDHRIVDGGDAGRFLQSIKKYLSNLNLLLLK